MTGTLEAEITADDNLTMCADLCNGTKHLSSQLGRRNDPRAELAGQGATVHLPVIQIVNGQQIPGQPGTVSHSWVVAYVLVSAGPAFPLLLIDGEVWTPAAIMVSVEGVPAAIITAAAPAVRIS